MSPTALFRVRSIAGVALVALVPGLAYAQDAQAPGTPQTQTAQQQASTESKAPAGGEEEIVVTGTLIRGKPPVGANLISTSPEKAEAQGANTANEILATIPQVTNLFSTVPNSRLGVAANQIQVVRPNLRNLSEETGSSASTLVLFDGHRLAGAGVTQSSVDPDLIPSAALERVEVVPDGGSATYGADAVGGVINFITRKRFDGVKVDARYGVGKDYWQYDADIIGGTDWGSGSVFAAYSYQRNDDIFGRDRKFVRLIDWTTGIPTGRSCIPGNVTLGGVNYALPGLTKGAISACDSSDDSTAFPKAKRQNAIIGLHQDLSDRITLDVKGFWAKRSAESTGPLRGNVNVTKDQFYYRPIAANPTGTQSVFFDFSPILGLESAPSGSGFTEWGTNAELKAGLFGDWEVRGLLNYSESKSHFFNVGFNQTLLAAAGAGTTAATAVNFYDPTATSNLQLIHDIANSEIAGQSRDKLFQARLLADGTLFTLPGGDVRLALGYEFLHDSFKKRSVPSATVPRGTVNTLPYTPYDRDVHSVFGELNVPIFGEGNRTGGLYSLVLSGSVRYDHFSDFGGTTNPKIGFTYNPVKWVAFRGNWSTSFNAPSPVNQLGSLTNAISFFPFNAFVKPGDVPNVQGTVAVQGSATNLVPQTAKTWTLGTDIDPPFVPGLHASLSYYNVKFKDLLTIPTPNSGIFTNFPNNVVSNVNGVTVQQLNDFKTLAANGPSVIDPIIARGPPFPYELVNFLVGNYGNLDVQGLDFELSYRHHTSYGGVDAGISGNYQLDRKSQVGPGAPVTDVLEFNTPRLTLQATVGVDIHAFRAQMTLNHVGGYDVVRTAVLPQDHVEAFDIINLFFRYNVPSSSKLLKDLSLTLNINNVLDSDPPVFKSFAVGAGNGYPQAEFTLGRLFIFGVSKKF
jgi:iron complex outermembrane recepter protein